MRASEINDNVYFIENNYRVVEAEIITKIGDFYTLKFDGCKSTRLRAGRLFPTFELAEQSIKNRTAPMSNLPPLLH